MTRDERMPWSSITSQLADGGGFWAFLGAVFTAACFAAVGLFKIRNAGSIARDADLKEREAALVEHLAAEVSRLNALIADLDNALKGQAIAHRQEMQHERDECNAKISGLQGEIEILKRRMFDEESR